MDNLCIDLYGYILSFLDKSEYYAFSETNKEYNNIYKKLKLNNEYPKYIYNINYLYWCLSHINFRLNIIHYINSIKMNDINLLNILIENNCPYNKIGYEYAIINENIDIILYLKNLNILPSKFVYLDAIETDNINIVKCLYSIRKFIGDALSFSIKKGNYKIFKYIFKKFIKDDIYFDKTMIFVIAIQSGNLKIVKFIYKYYYNDLSVNDIIGLDITNNNAMYLAKILQFSNIINWLSKKGYK